MLTVSMAMEAILVDHVMLDSLETIVEVITALIVVSCSSEMLLCDYHCCYNSN